MRVRREKRGGRGEYTAKSDIEAIGEKLEKTSQALQKRYRELAMVSQVEEHRSEARL